MARSGGGGRKKWPFGAGGMAFAMKGTEYENEKQLKIRRKNNERSKISKSGFCNPPFG